MKNVVFETKFLWNICLPEYTCSVAFCMQGQTCFGTVCAQSQANRFKELIYLRKQIRIIHNTTKGIT